MKMLLATIGLIGGFLVLDTMEANAAVVCARGVYRAGCVRAAPVVRRGVVVRGGPVVTRRTVVRRGPAGRTVVRRGVVVR